MAPLFAGGAGFGGWLGVWTGLSPVWLRMKQGPEGLGPIGVGRGWWARGVEFFSWKAAENKTYLAFLSFFLFRFFLPIKLKT